MQFLLWYIKRKWGYRIHEGKLEDILLYIDNTSNIIPKNLQQFIDKECWNNVI